jgi:anti-sigma factor RsiW
MIACSEAASWIALYIDNELAPAEAAELEAHFEECRGCRAQFEQLRAVSDNVRAAKPLYEPSATSAARVRELVRADKRRGAQRRIAVAAAAAVVLIGVALSYPWSRASAGAFSDFAAGSHIRYASGAAPLDLVSSEPERVTNWFAPRLPFHFKLPDYVNEPGSTKRYSLTGARLLEYRGADVAYLAYTMNRRPISLLVASSRRVTPAGGQTFRTGGIDFHFSSGRGLRLITWMDRGLSYALVSDLDVTGAESCVICHGAEADRRKIETLPH